MGRADLPRLESIDLFSGAGGLTWGLEAAGFHTVAAVDNDADCCASYSDAFPKVDLHHGAIQAISFRGFSGIPLLAGGPPCQPFSSGGKRLGDGDERNMVPEFIRAVKEAEPAAFLLENVPGLVSGKRRAYFEEILRALSRLGYHLTWQVLNAAEYGVPQKRRRLILVGMREKPFVFPAPTHGPMGDKPFAVVGDYLDVNTVLGEPNPSKVVYAKNPDLRPSPYDGHLFNGGGRPIDLNAPSHTILAAAGGNKTHFLDTLNLVPEYHKHLLAGGEPRSGTLPGGRRLTVAESAILQTFPRTARFAGSRSSQYSQVGNAVPPLLATVIGVAIRAQLLGDEAPGFNGTDEIVDLFDVRLEAVK